MPFNINDFSSELNKHGVARASDFAVIITPPAGAIYGPEKWMDLRIESVNLPSRSLMTIEQRYHGPIRYIPYSVIFTPVTLTVLLSENMIERDFFMTWQDLAVSANGDGDARRGITTSEGKYDANFYEEAIGTLEIQQYANHADAGGGGILGTALGVAQAIGIDPSPIIRPLGFDLGLVPKQKPAAPKSRIILNECYPRTVNEVLMNWNNGDELAKLQVEMIYFDVKEIYPEDNPGLGGGTGIPGLIRKGISTINKFKPLVSGIKNGSLTRNLKNSVGSSVNNGLNNIKIF